MESKTIKNRKLLYKKLKKESNSVKVYSRDKSEIGYVIGESTPYIGEAGYSNRCRVLWRDGKVTLCAYKGMQESKGSYTIL